MAGPKTAKVVLRGAFNRIAQWSPSSTTVPFGIVPATALGINYAATVGVAPWDATIAGTSTSLMTPSTTLTYYGPTGAQFGNAVTVTTTTAPGPRWINFLGSLFGLGYGASTQLNDAGSTYTINASAVLKSSIAPTAVLKQSKTISLGTSGTAGVTQTQDATGTISFTEQASDWVVTGTTWPNGAVTNQLEISSLGFSVPTGSSIVGIAVEGVVLGNTGSPYAVDSGATVSGGTGTSSNLATSTSISSSSNGYPTIIDYGGSTSLWGMTWTPAQINAAAFGFNWQFLNNTGSSQPIGTTHGSGGLFIEPQQISVTVYYVGTSTSYSAPVAQTGYPTGSVDITQYQSRLWLAQGCDVPGSGTYHEPTTIFWTNPVTSTNPLANTSADWRYTDPVSGITTTNKVVIDNNGADPVMGFGRVTGAMIIFRRSSIYVLKGSTTANYQIIKVSGDVGCLDPRSIVESDGGVYFMSLQGLMLTNGSKVVSVSEGVAQSLQSALSYEQSVVLAGNANAQSGWISSGITSQGHICVSVGVMGTAAAAVPVPTDVQAPVTSMRTLWSAIYNPTVGSWYRITSFLFGIDSGLWNPDTFNGVPDVPQLFVSNRLVGQRSLHVVGNAGITTLEDQTFGTSFLTSGSLYDTVNSGAPGYASPEVGFIQGLIIPARWHTKMAAVVGTTTLNRRYGMPKRFFLDHTLAVSNTGVFTTNYDGTSIPTSYKASLTSLAGANTAWTVTTSSGALLPTRTLESDTPIGTASIAASASSNVLLMVPPAMGTVPSDATITGVQVVIYKNGAAFDGSLQLYNAGAALGVAYTNGTNPTPAFYANGGASDLWGAALTPAIINSGTFGVGVVVTNEAGTTGDVVVYLANIIVYYTVPSGTPVSLNASSWQVVPYDSDGAAYPVTLNCALANATDPADPRTGPSCIAPVTGNTILRENCDFSSEMADLTYDITLPSIQSYTSVLGPGMIGPAVSQVSFTNVIGELYGIGTEYQWAHDLRSKTN